MGTPWLCPLPDLSKPPFLATSFLAGFPVALSRKRRSVPVRPAATASFESAPVFEGQPLRGFTSDVFVALPGSSGGENKRDELVSWCGPRSPLLGEQAALPGSPAAAQGSRQGRYPPLALLPSECGWGGPGAGAARAVTPGWSLRLSLYQGPLGIQRRQPPAGPSPRSAHFTHGPGHQQEGWGPERLPGGGAGQAEFRGWLPTCRLPTKSSLQFPQIPITDLRGVGDSDGEPGH